MAILLVMGGKLHWIAGAIAATLPLAQRFFPLIIRAIPFLKRNKNEGHTSSPHAASNSMDREKALQVFGFDALPTAEKVVQRHRELIQKNHPDRGGSDFLAAQINQAKDVLLAESKTS
ncbi:MAG: hypothetical protein ACJATV_000872 [Granulosicoccus sp.]